MFLFLLFILGSIIGSFLSCAIQRLEREENFILGRSSCSHCCQTLHWQDLIPLLSFIFLKGKCRYCQKQIAWQDFFIELFTAVLFAFLGLVAPDLLYLGYYLMISSFLLVVFVYDLKHCLIPDKAVYFIAGMAFFWQLFYEKQIINPLLAGLGAAGFFLIIYIITRKKGLGLGDAEIAFFMGLFLGFPKILLALFLAFASGALLGVILILLNKKTMKSELAFGPFLIAATLFCQFYGQPLIDFYIKLFKY